MTILTNTTAEETAKVTDADEDNDLENDLSMAKQRRSGYVCINKICLKISDLLQEDELMICTLMLASLYLEISFHHCQVAHRSIDKINFVQIIHVTAKDHS